MNSAAHARSAAPAASAAAAQVAVWADAPWALDFFAALRRLEAQAAPAPRWGQALLPRHEAVRVGEEPSLAFAPASFSRFEAPARGYPPRLRQLFFGYLGPNGPLPIHLSDYVRERSLNLADPTWLAFLDTFSHRFALHLYRAWAQPRPAVALDRAGDEPWRRWVGALIGIGTPTRQRRDAVLDDARLHFAGWLARRVHNAEGVQRVLAAYLGVAVRLERWVGHWMAIDPHECTRLGASHPNDASRRLGGGALLGQRVWDRQHRVRLHLGPLTLAQYQGFLPGGSARTVLQCWMQQLLGDELAWDAELILRRDEVPPARLGSARGNAPRMGWVCWLGSQARTQPARDVRIPASDTKEPIHE